MTFQKCYNVLRTKEKFFIHCEKMGKKGTPGSYLELQVASDIFFVVVEIYREEQIEEPYQVIMPLRFRTVLPGQCQRRVKLLIQNSNHCVSLSTPEKQLMVKPFQFYRMLQTTLVNISCDLKANEHSENEDGDQAGDHDLDICVQCTLYSAIGWDGLAGIWVCKLVPLIFSVVFTSTRKMLLRQISQNQAFKNSYKHIYLLNLFHAF